MKIYSNTFNWTNSTWQIGVVEMTEDQFNEEQFRLPSPSSRQLFKTEKALNAHLLNCETIKLESLKSQILVVEDAIKKYTEKYENT